MATRAKTIPTFNTEPTIRCTETPAARITISSEDFASVERPKIEPIRAAIGNTS